MVRSTTKKPKPRNKFETKLYNSLKEKGCVFSYESERIPYILPGHYIPDFIVLTKSGVVYVEAKGYFRAASKAKMRAVKRQHPNLDIRIVFYKFDKAYKKWAEKYGFRFAFCDIPQEWLEGR